MTGAAASLPKPDRWRPSVTVAAIISRRDADGQTRFLLIEEHTAEGLRLNNPAGHLDPAESPEQAVVREALEETARVFTCRGFSVRPPGRTSPTCDWPTPARWASPCRATA